MLLAAPARSDRPDRRGRGSRPQGPHKDIFTEIDQAATWAAYHAQRKKPSPIFSIRRRFFVDRRSPVIARRCWRLSESRLLGGPQGHHPRALPAVLSHGDVAALGRASAATGTGVTDDATATAIAAAISVLRLGCVVVLRLG